MQFPREQSCCVPPCIRRSTVSASEKGFVRRSSALYLKEGRFHWKLRQNASSQLDSTGIFKRLRVLCTKLLHLQGGKSCRPYSAIIWLQSFISCRSCAAKSSCRSGKKHKSIPIRSFCILRFANAQSCKGQKSSYFLHPRTANNKTLLFADFVVF